MTAVILSAAAEQAEMDPFNPFPLPENLNMAQILFLTAMYGYVLFQASNLISDSSELLLLVPSLAGIVGSIVLPTAGAVPDGVMILCSGLGPDAQNQVSVGVGALAGSTIMLLTLPWFLAVLAGRVNIKQGRPTYQRPPGATDDSWDKLSPAGNFDLFGTGVGFGAEIQSTAKVMLVTLIGYFIIQVPAFMVDTQPKPDVSPTELKNLVTNEARQEKNFALVGLIICMLQFIWYLYKQWTGSNSGSIDDQIAEVTVQALLQGSLNLRGAMAAFREKNWNSICDKKDLEQVLLNKESMDEVRRMCKVLVPFFAHYDKNGDRLVDFEEFRMILKDVHEHVSREAQWAMFKAADTDGSGSISFQEFAACMISFALDPSIDLQEKNKPKYRADTATYMDEDDGQHEEEEEDIPEDLADLDPEEQQKRIKMRAFSQMALGTLLVLVFSDPMVELLSEIGKRTGVSPFYISFVLAPLASNASELVAAYNYAKKKTRKSITTSLSTLEGAAVMNNTFCLGIFLALVYFNDLAWEFTAETIVIIVIQVFVALNVLRHRVQRLFDAFVILSLYPLSLALVWVLENVYGLD
jgi:Ca2+/Na+ antiporter